MPKRMTEKQVAANRANAHKSTGPRSETGKAAARYNAVRHGHFAREVLLPGDSAVEFEELLEGVRAQLQPEGTLEELIVQRLAAAYWRLRRAYRFEAKAIQDLVNWEPNPLQSMAGNMLGMTPPRPNANLPGAGDLHRLLRYETLLDRELSHAMSQLRHLTRNRQATAASDDAATPPAASTEPPAADAPAQPPQPNPPSPSPSEPQCLTNTERPPTE
jgi:hypothetical protein